MPKFRYYIASVMDGELKGTDNEEVVRQLCDSDECFIVDTATGMWVTMDMTEVEIAEQELYKTDIGEEDPELDPTEGESDEDLSNRPDPVDL